MLNSKARNDKCGVCGGDNSSCRTVAGTFNNAQYGKSSLVQLDCNTDVKTHSSALNVESSVSVQLHLV